MSDALEQARRATLRAIRNKAVPPNSAGAYIWQFHDEGGPFWCGVFNAARFASHNPERYTLWIMGKERGLIAPHPDDREAISLLPQGLQKRIKSYEKQRINNESAESGNR